jgi:hypothetical protein
MPSNPFRFRTTAKSDFFKHIGKDSNGFDLDFDIIYFCFMASMAAGGRKTKKDAVLTKDTEEPVDYFPGRYAGRRSRLLIALFLSKELELFSVDMTEKSNVHKVISHLVEPDAPSRLSNEGITEFNRYVYGGLDVLYEWYGDAPRSLDAFLRGFKEKSDIALAKN